MTAGHLQRAVRFARSACIRRLQRCYSVLRAAEVQPVEGWAGTARRR